MNSITLADPCSPSDAIRSLRLAFSPESLLDVIPREMCRTLLAGFSHDLKSGVSLLYATADADCITVKDESRTDPVNPSSDAAEGFYNPVCNRFRRCGGEGACRMCDLKKARQYVTGNPVATRLTTPELYECHLGMDDQAFPVYIGNICYGVVLAGQLIPDDPVRQAKIRSALPAELRVHLDNAVATGEYSSTRQIEQKRRSLTDFAGLLQRILDEIHDARQKAASERYVQNVGESLARADLSESSTWWAQILPVLEDFRELMGLADLRVFQRYTTYFSQEYPIKTGQRRPPRIATRDIVIAIKPDTLVSAADSKATRELESQLGMAADGVQFHLTSTRAGERHLSTLVVLKGTIPSRYADVAQRFCRTLGLRMEIASLVFALREAHRTYIQSVTDTAHDVRTPLEALTLRAEAFAESQGDGSIEKQYANELVSRIFEIVPLLDALQEKTRPARTVINIAELIGQVVGTMRPLADKHPCRLEFAYLGERITVRVDQNQIKRAIQNILDNGIKYSWHGSNYVVRVSISLTAEGRYVRVRTINYGIGVPDTYLSDFSERGRRALVADERYPRGGTGTGLPSAFDIIKDHGGWIDLHSKPAGDAVRNPAEEYHRYLTTVDIYLPTI